MSPRGTLSCDEIFAVEVLPDLIYQASESPPCKMPHALPHYYLALDSLYQMMFFCVFNIFLVNYELIISLNWLINTLE